MIRLDGMASATTISEFVIYAKRPVQSALVSSRVEYYKPAPVSQADLELVILV